MEVYLERYSADLHGKFSVVMKIGSGVKRPRLARGSFPICRGYVVTVFGHGDFRGCSLFFLFIRALSPSPIQKLAFLLVFKTFPSFNDMN